MVDGASRRGRICWIASVCCCTAENCWAKPSTVSPNSPAWEMGASRKRALSTSFISARLSQRWCSWTTMVDIAFPRDRAVTFVARRARLVAVRSFCINPRVGTILVHLFECLGLVNLQDSHGVQGKGCLAHSTISFGRERGRQLTGFGWETRFPQVTAFCEHRCTTIALSTWGMPVYPLASPPWRVVRTEEMDEWLLAVKGAIHDFVISSCTSGKKRHRSRVRL